MSKGIPASKAIAREWSIVLEEPPKAISTAIAFSMAFLVIISKNLTFFLNNSIILIPVCFANIILRASTAGIVPLPGRAIPTASAQIFIELAVYRPAHEPTPGQAQSSTSFSSCSLIEPV
ncbi:hypothetical protein ES708_29456 [subsurface metagenome]